MPAYTPQPEELGAFTGRLPGQPAGQSQGNSAPLTQTPNVPSEALDFASKLRAISKPSSDRMQAGVSPKGQTPGQALGQSSGPTQAPRPVEKTGLSALADMLARSAKPASQVSQSARKPVQAPKSTFVAGKKPEPTGPTAREIFSDPGHKQTLHQVISQLEAQGGALKAPRLVATWNTLRPDAPLNEARARTIISKVNRVRDEFLVKQVGSYFGQGAKKAVLK